MSSVFLRARVFEYTTTTGTGTLQLLGAASAGYQSFLTAFGNGARCYYFANDTNGLYEYGLGTINASSQLARTLILGGSSGLSAVNFAAGTKTVICSIPPGACVANGIFDVPDNVTTTPVLNCRVCRFNNSGTVTVTAFTSGVDGQELILVNIGGNTVTIQNNANIKTEGGSNQALTTHDVMSIVHYNGVWYQMAPKSINS
jgi:hypothetical protein